MGQRMLADVQALQIRGALAIQEDSSPHKKHPRSSGFQAHPARPLPKRRDPLRGSRKLRSELAADYAPRRCTRAVHRLSLSLGIRAPALVLRAPILMGNFDSRARHTVRCILASRTSCDSRSATCGSPLQEYGFRSAFLGRSPVRARPPVGSPPDIVRVAKVEFGTASSSMLSRSNPISRRAVVTFSRSTTS